MLKKDLLTKIIKLKTTPKPIYLGNFFNIERYFMEVIKRTIDFILFFLLC